MRYQPILVGLALAAVSAWPVVAQQTPPPLVYVQPLPPPAVQSVQARLQQAGVYAGAIDGIWGVDSEAALQRFQQAHQLQVTGQLNQATAATLGLDPNALVTVQAAAPAPPPLAPDRLLPASVRAVQARLGTLGYYSGPVDGVWGGATEAAVVNFQRSSGLPQDGELGPATVTALGLGPDGLAYR